MLRTTVVGGLLFAALVLAGCKKTPDKGAPAPGQPAKAGGEQAAAAGYQTPREALDAFIAAVNKGDRLAEVRSYPADLVKRMAANYAINNLYRKRMSNDPAFRFADFTPVFAVLAKHGLTDEATKSINVAAQGPDRDRAKGQLLALVKDPPAFLAEAMDAENRLRDRDRPPQRMQVEVVRADFQVTGDQAKGIIPVKMNGKEENLSLVFVKGADGWKVVPPDGGDRDDFGTPGGAKDMPAKDRMPKDRTTTTKKP